MKDEGKSQGGLCHHVGRRFDAMRLDEGEESGAQAESDAEQAHGRRRLQRRICRRRANCSFVIYSGYDESGLLLDPYV